MTCKFVVSILLLPVLAVFSSFLFVFSGLIIVSCSVFLSPFS